MKFRTSDLLQFARPRLWLALLFLLPVLCERGRGEVLVVLLAGQSNMDGNVPIAALPEDFRKPPEKVGLINRGQPEPIAGGKTFGPEVAFAATIAAARPSDEVLLVKRAMGGTSLAGWAPQWDESRLASKYDTAAGPIYRRLLEDYAAAIQGRSARLTGVLWMQGESDTRYPALGPNYYENFKTLIAAFRRDLNAPELPFFFGRVNMPADATEDDHKTIKFPYIQQVRAAQERAAHDIPGVHLIETDDLGKQADRIHYDAAGQIALGRRFAEAWLTTLGTPAAPALRAAPDMRDWREAKFGMFIHWGLYARLAGSYEGREIDNNGEWIMDRAVIPVAKYAAYARDFNPVKFDATEWVRIAKDAGMKYIVITAKHHDGFAMYPSKVSPFNLRDATPFQRDPLAELSEACRKEGLRLGFYYSQAMDWHHPGGQPPGRGWWDDAQHGNMTNYVDTIAVPQVRELLSNYGPVFELWWDIPRNMTPELAGRLLDVVQECQPGVIMNDRLGGGVKGDLDTPEQFIPSTGGPPGRDWETCMTMNNTWGFKQQDTDWKSASDLLRKLLDICHKGGNFLLNVGPTAEGEIPAASVERLREIGAWLQKNGESVYGTTGSPVPFLSWGRCTRRGNTLYLHVFDWPKNGVLRMPMRALVVSAHLLADPARPLTTGADDRAVLIHLPAKAPDAIASVIKLTLDGEPVVDPPLTRGKPASASFGAAQKAFDGSAGSGWEAKKGDREGWIEVDLQQSVSVAAMAFDEPHRGAGKRGQKFRLQVREGTEWREIITGETKSTGVTQTFPAVTGQVFRLEIFESKDTAAVSELQLYSPE